LRDKRKSTMVFGLGGGGLKVYISIDPFKTDPNKIGQLDHLPNWKIRKNPFQISTRRHVHPVQPNVAPNQVNQYPGPNAIPPNMNMNPHVAMPMPVTVNAQQNNQLYAFDASQNVSGTITLVLPHGKRYDHLGIKAQFVGRISTLAMQRFENRAHYDFVSLSKELSPPGSIYTSTVQFPFEFKNMEKPYETYHGRNCYVSYVIRVFVERKFLPPLVEEKEITIQSPVPAPTANEPIKMEVGIEDCLHIEFEYEKRRYHLKDVIKGKIHFLLVKIKIKYMELAVIRRETSGDAQGGNIIASTPGARAAANNNSSGEEKNVYTQTQTLVRQEIMDGAPVKGEVVPVRLHLGGIPADLTPTFEAAQNKRFSVRYFLNLVLVDEEDRRYFKQQEIILWRKDLGD